MKRSNDSAGTIESSPEGPVRVERWSLIDLVCTTLFKSKKSLFCQRKEKGMKKVMALKWFPEKEPK